MSDLIKGMKEISTFGMTRVEVVPDDATTFPGLEDEMVAKLDLDGVLIAKNAKIMYLRKSQWEKMKHHFPEVHEIQ